VQAVERAQLSSVPRVRRISARHLEPYAFIAPAFAVLGVVLIYPMLQNVYLSFHAWSFATPEKLRYVGLSNYQQLTTDPIFGEAFAFTMLFAVTTIAAELAIGLGGALLLASIGRLRFLATSVVLLPYMIASIAVGLTWRLLWTSGFGLINYLLMVVGIRPPAWLADQPAVFFAVVIPEIWHSTPFVTLILLAGLLSQPLDVYEAARVDGANAWQTFGSITLPLLRPAVAVALLFETIYKLRVFDLVYILTNGGPGTQTQPLGLLIYRRYFLYTDGGSTAAISVVLLVLGLLTSVFYIRVVYRQEPAT
jgi:multiple sugar transport system permease protein